MSYIIKQISDDFQTVGTQESASLKYMVPVLDGIVTNEHRVMGGRNFVDSGVHVQSGITKGVRHYFYAKVLKSETQQDFNILLTTKSGSQRQFLNKMSVAPISRTRGVEYAEFEVVFTPAADFDTIVFELVRNEEDAIIPRTSVVIFEELDIINNLLLAGVNASKITVQSNPGLLMCINGQEIRVGRTGVYELNNQALKITSFGIAAAGEDNEQPAVESSVCLFKAEKTRTYPAFVLDYMYEQED